MVAKPEWTERMDKRGLDPLGMQNAGIALYQSLLPGISNVTLRMRYYGFYCWVSDAYARNDPTDEFADWRSWVRRAEALYALVAARAEGEGGVGGVDWANRRLALEEDVIDFAQAASNDTNVERYLRQQLGAFGGAYYSQMVELGLFRLGEHGIQRATKGGGQAAAKAFSEAIGEKTERLLLRAIRSARVTPAQLDALHPIIPSQIEEDSAERDAYERILFSPDDASQNDASRSATLKLILLTADALGYRPSTDDIRWHLFDCEQLNDERLERQRLRWEAYQCQDLVQIAAASLLEWASVLMGEDDAGRTLGEIGAAVCDRLKTTGSDTSKPWSHFRSGIDEESFDYQSTWASLTGQRQPAEQKAGEAVSLIAALEQRLRARPELDAVARQELSGKGNGRSILTELAWFARRENEQIRDLIASYVVERVLRRHSWVAMQKLRRQRDYTFLFEVRDGRLVRRAGYLPVATTPRLGPATTFLYDIGLLDDEGATARGRALLGANA